MVDNVDLLVALFAFLSSESVVYNWAVEPARIIKSGKSWSIIVHNWFGEVVSIVENSVVDDDIFRVVGSIDCASWGIEEAIMRIISIGDVEGEVAEYIMEYQNRDLILSEHQKDVIVSNCNVVTEVTSNLYNQIVESGIEVENIIEWWNCWQSASVYHNHRILSFGESFIDGCDVDEISFIWEVNIEVVRDDVAVCGIFTIEDHITCDVELVDVVFLDDVGWVDKDEFASGNGHFPFVESWLLSSRWLELSKQDGSCSGHVQNDNSIKTLNEEDEGMEIWGKNIDGREVLHSDFGHCGRIDGIDSIARIGEEVSASL